MVLWLWLCCIVSRPETSQQCFSFWGWRWDLSPNPVISMMGVAVISNPKKTQ